MEEIVRDLKSHACHQLFPDFVTQIEDEQNESNHFTLTLNPSLARVSFKDIPFKIEDNKTLSYPCNYLMMMADDVKFVKE